MSGSQRRPNDGLREFSLTAAGWEQCLAELRRRFELKDEPARRLARTFYDTFDWRLHRRGQILYTERRTRESALTLVWHDTRRGAKLSLPMAAVPRAAADLPPRLRSRLGAIIEPRVLLAAIELRGTRFAVSVLDGNAKTVARLEQASWTVYAGGRTRGRVGGRVTLESLRGFGGVAAKVAECLRQSGACADATPVLNAALACIERVPGDYASKFEIALDPAQTAQQATVALCKHLVETLERNQEGVRAGTDPEFLHDFRVAVRRTRALLAQTKNVFGVRALEPFGTEFAWLAGETSELRDLDVQLLALKQSKCSLAPLMDHLQQRRGRAADQLNNVLESQRYRSLLKDWTRFLDADETASGRYAEQPVSAFAGTRIWRVYRRVIREGRAIHSESPPTALHELRKTCKKLRYLIEAYQSLYPAGLVSHRIKELKRLQDQLGGFQDCSVEQESLARCAHELAASGVADAEVLMEIGRMLERSRMRQNTVRYEFDARFAAFASNHRAFARLFKP